MRACRSSDYGSTYTKLADQAARTLLSYLYVCPTNKQKVGISLSLLSLSASSLSSATWDHLLECVYFQTTGLLPSSLMRRRPSPRSVYSR